MNTITITTELMPHQINCVEKLRPIKLGALFADMGTGKSLMALALIARKAARISRVIWFTPVRLMHNVKAQIEEHSIGASIYVFDDKTSLRTIDKRYDIYIIGIESMSASRRIMLCAAALVDARSMVIVDESSLIKGHRASRTTWITRIGDKARYRLILSGSPVSQGIVDLFSQMRFLSPEILGYKSFYSFAANHLEYDEKFRGRIVKSHNTDYVAAKIAPYCYQVTREECLTLPPQLYEIRRCYMSYAQWEMYEIAKLELLSEIDYDVPDGCYIDAAPIYRLFTALQQITCGFWHRIERKPRSREIISDEIRTVNHNRLSLLEQTLSEISDTEQIIIWSKYRRCIDEITELINREFKGGTIRIDGSVSTKKQTDSLHVFQTGGARFLIGTPSAGGMGLTLTNSAYAVYYTNSFKHSERSQSEARQHRISQTRPVTYINIGVANTIDERIEANIANKQNVVELFRDNLNRLRDKKSVIAAIKAL